MNDLLINIYEFYIVFKIGILRKICMRNIKKKKNFVRNIFILYMLLDEYVIVLLLII